MRYENEFGLLDQYRDKFRIRRDDSMAPYFRCGNQKQAADDQIPNMVYEYSSNTFGVWLTTGKPVLKFRAIRDKWPSAELMQEGEGEITFIFRPKDRAEGIKFLRSIKTHKVFELSEAEKKRRLELLQQSNKAPEG